MCIKGSFGFLLIALILECANAQTCPLPFSRVGNKCYHVSLQEVRTIRCTRILFKRKNIISGQLACCRSKLSKTWCRTNGARQSRGQTPHNHVPKEYGAILHPKLASIAWVTGEPFFSPGTAKLCRT